MHLKNIKKYLPSKEFQRIFFFIIIILLILFIIFYVLPNTKIFNDKKENSLELYNKTIGEMIETDTDGDSIPDWEERLWGTDINNKFTFGDTSDSVYIQSKREELKLNNEINQKELTETDIFAREFFTSYMALKSTDAVDNETINNFTSVLGQKMLNKEVKNKYLKSDVVIDNNDTLQNREAYYEKISAIYDKYTKEGLGDEIKIITNNLSEYSLKEKEGDYSELILIAESYKNFAEELMKNKVPKSLADYHLEIANNSYIISESLSYLSKIEKDTVVAVSGLAIYEEYSEKLIKSVNDLKLVIEEKLE